MRARVLRTLAALTLAVAASASFAGMASALGPSGQPPDSMWVEGCVTPDMAERLLASGAFTYGGSGTILCLEPYVAVGIKVGP